MPTFRFKYGGIESARHEIPRGWRVSVAVYNAEGRIVREMVCALPVGDSDITAEWNGRADPVDVGGRLEDGPLLRGYFKWRLLAYPGLKAQYLMTLCSTLPVQNDDEHQAEFWETGLGNHVGPRSVAVGEDRSLYLGGGDSENVRNALSMRWDERARTWSQCRWSAFVPVPAEAAAGNAGKHLGRWSLAVLKVGGEERLYHLQQDGRVGWHGVGSPNKRREQYVFNPTNKDNVLTVGGGWDALWPCERRPTPKDWREDASYPEVPMDMTAGYIDGLPVIVTSHLKQDLVQVRHPDDGLVLASATVKSPKGVALDGRGRLLVVSRDRVLRLNLGLSTGMRLYYWMPHPRVERWDWLRCISANIARRMASPTPHEVLIEGLDSPYRLAFDPSNGDILVAETGRGQQVKRFAGNADNPNPYRPPKKTYGLKGGRGDGQYIKHYFRDVVDICADGRGGFLVVEDSAPRRVAHVRDGPEGAFDYSVREWYGGTCWVPTASPDPSDPSSVWVTATPHEVMRLRLNYDYRSNNRPPYQVEAVHRFTDLKYTYQARSADGSERTQVGHIGPLVNAGVGDWHARRRRENNGLYLVRRGFIEVLRVDHKPRQGWGRIITQFDEELVPVAVVQPLEKNQNDPTSPWPFTWVKNRMPSEYVEYPPTPSPRVRPSCGATANNLQSLHAPAYFDYFRLRVNDDDPGLPRRNGNMPEGPDEGGVYRLSLLGWTSAAEEAAPVYDLTKEEEGELLVQGAPRNGWVRVHGPLPGLGHKHYFQRPQGAFAQSSPEGPLYVAVNRQKMPPPDSERDFVEFAGMYRLDNLFHLGRMRAQDPERGWAWRAGLWLSRRYGGREPGVEYPPPPGGVYSLWTNVGVVSRNFGGTYCEVVVATDYDGGWSGASPAIVYAWDWNGLYVNPFETTGGVPGQRRNAPMNVWAYVHSSDNRSGTLLDVKGRATPGLTDGVLYFAGAENEVRVYLITGWHGDDRAGWMWAEGEVNIP